MEGRKLFRWREGNCSIELHLMQIASGHLVIRPFTETSFRINLTLFSPLLNSYRIWDIFNGCQGSLSFAGEMKIATYRYDKSLIRFVTKRGNCFKPGLLLDNAIEGFWFPIWLTFKGRAPQTYFYK